MLRRSAVALAREGFALAKRLRSDTAGVVCGVREWSDGKALASALEAVAKVAGAYDGAAAAPASADDFVVPHSMEVVVYITGGGMGGSPPLPLKLEAQWGWPAFVSAVERMFGVTVKSVRNTAGAVVGSLRGVQAGEVLAIVPGAVEGTPLGAALAAVKPCADVFRRLCCAIARQQFRRWSCHSKEAVMLALRMRQRDQ